MPYLSVVAVAESGEAAGFVERWNEQARRHGLSSEVIPVAADSRSRNGGIRQASGDFLLAAAAETVFPDELIRFLASRPLQAYACAAPTATMPPGCGRARACFP